MNPANGQVTQTGNGLQPQASQTQTTATGIQTGSRLSQDSNNSSESLLNQGVSQGSLTVVSSPNSTTPAAVATLNSPALQTPAQSAGGSSLLTVLIIGGLLVAASVATWNRYIKTPVPSRQKRR